MLRPRIEDGLACLAMSLRDKYDIRESEDRVYEYKTLTDGNIEDAHHHVPTPILRCDHKLSLEIGKGFQRVHHGISWIHELQSPR
jgi:hypothetical protein